MRSLFLPSFLPFFTSLLPPSFALFSLSKGRLQIGVCRIFGENSQKRKGKSWIVLYIVLYKPGQPPQIKRFPSLRNPWNSVYLGRMSPRRDVPQSYTSIPKEWKSLRLFDETSGSCIAASFSRSSDWSIVLAKASSFLMTSSLVIPAKWNAAVRYSMPL